MNGGPPAGIEALMRPWLVWGLAMLVGAACSGGVPSTIAPGVDAPAVDAPAPDAVPLPDADLLPDAADAAVDAPPPDAPDAAPTPDAPDAALPVDAAAAIDAPVDAPSGPAPVELGAPTIVATGAYALLATPTAIWIADERPGTGGAAAVWLHAIARDGAPQIAPVQVAADAHGPSLALAGDHLLVGYTAGGLRVAPFALDGSAAGPAVALSPPIATGTTQGNVPYPSGRLMRTAERSAAVLWNAVVYYPSLPRAVYLGKLEPLTISGASAGGASDAPAALQYGPPVDETAGPGGAALSLTSVVTWGSFGVYFSIDLTTYPADGSAPTVRQVDSFLQGPSVVLKGHHVAVGPDRTYVTHTRGQGLDPRDAFAFRVDDQTDAALGQGDLPTLAPTAAGAGVLAIVRAGGLVVERYDDDGTTIIRGAPLTLAATAPTRLDAFPAGADRALVIADGVAHLIQR